MSQATPKKVRVKRNGLWIYVDYAVWAYSRARAKERREAQAAAETPPRAQDRR